MVVDASQIGQGSPSQGQSSPQEGGSAQGSPAGQPGGAQPPQRPAPPASGGGAGAGAATPAETGGTRPSDDEEDPETTLAQRPRLRRYLDSRVGDLAQRQAREIADRIAAEQESNRQAQARLERRRQLRESDPEAFAKFDAEEENRWQTEQQVGQRVKTETQQEFWAGFDNMLFNIQFSLPPEAQKEIEGKTFRSPDGDPWASRRLYLTAMQDAAIKHRVNGSIGPALSRAREDITEAARLEANGQARSGQPALDTQGGNAPGGEFVSQAEWDANRGNREWRTANKERINRSVGRYILS